MYDRWKSFKWYVTLIKGGQSLHRYKQLSRMQNERHNVQFYVETTFYDKIYNLRMEYDRLKQERTNVSAPDVVKAFTGCKHIVEKRTRSMVQTAGAVIRIPMEVIHAIGTIINSEHPDICLSSPNLNRFKYQTVDEVMSSEDCRVFRNFINITSLKSSKAFMNGSKSDSGLSAQINTIYRAQTVSLENGFKPVQHETISKLYQMACDASIEVKKFEDFIFPDKWPSEMITLRNNALRTTILDDEMELNRGNSKLLKSFMDSYKRHFPLLYLQKELNQKKKLEKNNISNPTKKQDKNATDATADKSERKSNEEEPSRTNLENKKKEGSSASVIDDQSTAPNNDDEISADETVYLKKYGISCHNMTWQSYMKEIWTSDNAYVDAIIMEPPAGYSRSVVISERAGKRSRMENIDKSEVNEIPSFCRKLLKSGGYVIVIAPWSMFQEWYHAFSSNGFNVLDTPYIISYKRKDNVGINASTVPKRSKTIWPMKVHDFLMLARVPGAHPSGFEPDWNAFFNFVGNGCTRSSAEMCWTLIILFRIKERIM